MPHDKQSRLVPSEALEIQQELDRVLASAEFKDFDRGGGLLGYVVREALAGRRQHLEFSVVAHAVFHKDSSNGEETELAVRIETDRIRRALERYYDGAGQNDRVRIGMTEDGYTPIFFRRFVAETTMGDDSPGGKLSDEQRSEDSQPLQDGPLTYRDMLLPIGVPLAVIAIIILAVLKPVRTLFF